MGKQRLQAILNQAKQQQAKLDNLDNLLTHADLQARKIELEVDKLIESTHQ